MFDIKEELKKLPQKPGVYLMKDSQGEIIYVGKAIILKNRVRQYFQNSSNHTNKIKTMVSQIRSFEYIVTDSELEALILECNLIKKHQPRYNTMLKDDRTYPYIKITINEAFPRLFLSRDMMKDKAKYFGPYTSGLVAKEMIELIRKIWKIRTCSRNLPKDVGKERPCLYYHMHQCDAPCQGYISSEDYKKQIEEVIEFLNGKHEEVIQMLEEQMFEASEAMNFERAAELRDQINNIKVITQKQKIVNTSMVDQDIIAMANSDKDAVIQVFFIRNGKMLGREHFHLEGVDGLTRSEIMTAFVKQYYSSTPYIPKELILQEDTQESEIISQWLTGLRGQKVYITVPQKGEKSRLVDLAEQNATITLERINTEFQRKLQRTKGAMGELLQLLGLPLETSRVEAYDISNTQGFESVGSMVVFEDGEPKRKDYRKFKIKTVQGANDYASLEEILTRRFNRAFEEQLEILEKGLESGGKFARLPDLIMMDGGKGQVNVALGVLEYMGLEIPVCGMVKDDNHRTRGLYYKGEEIPISSRSEAFKLITRIQDEAHRFAIEYHKKLRSKKQVRSVLDDIEGIGPQRRKNLLKHFGSVEKIKKASVDELAKVPAMNVAAAKSIYNYFHHTNESKEES